MRWTKRPDESCAVSFRGNFGAEYPFLREKSRSSHGKNATSETHNGEGSGMGVASFDFLVRLVCLVGRTG